MSPKANYYFTNAALVIFNTLILFVLPIEFLGISLPCTFIHFLYVKELEYLINNEEYPTTKILVLEKISYIMLFVYFVFLILGFGYSLTFILKQTNIFRFVQHILIVVNVLVLLILLNTSHELRKKMLGS